MSPLPEIPDIAPDALSDFLPEILDEPETVEFAMPEGAAERIDLVLTRLVPELSRSRAQGLIRDGHARCNGVTIREPKHRVKPGALLALDLPAPLPAAPAGENIPLTVVFEDAHLIVIDKPAGLVVHPAAGHATGTLVNALIAHCGDSLSGIGGERRPGIVHRLDKDTTGLMVVAKSDAAHQGLAEQFAAHGADGLLQRAYLALVWGGPRRPAGVVDAPLGRHNTERTKMAVVSSTHAAGRHAVTHYAVEEKFRDEDQVVASLVRCQLETGRTHQIRVHMAHLGCPVLGDATYGRGFATRAVRLSDAARTELTALARQALHATLLGFTHPITGRAMRFESPPPADMAALLAALRAPRP
jgi:23S rRNA pseudouridine1911/1915/1917 synthase